MGFTINDATNGSAHDLSGVRSVAIIGAGVAGLQTARALTAIGKDVTVFDKAPTVGGVWRENYADFGLQVPKELYEFPDFPYPSDTEWAHFPKGDQVQAYIERYADAFGLRALCQFETSVQAVAPRADGARGYTLTYTRKGADQPTSADYDYVVMATGMYSTHAHLPLAKDAATFKGEVLHSSTFLDAQQAAGKKVVVIGGGKSAIDNAVAAAKAEGADVTLLFREAHWPVPRLLADLIPFKFGTYSRFGHFMLPAHFEESRVSWWFHSLLAPAKWAWWRIVEQLFTFQFGLTGDLVPSVPIEHDLFSGGQILNYDFRRMLKAKALNAKKGAVARFTDSGVVLADGTELAADVVIYGTGFTKSYDVLDPAIRAKLPMEKDGLYLYRNVLAPRVADLAFVGSEVSTFNNLLTHSLQAQWLKRAMAGEMALPAPGAMEQAIELEQAWKRSWMPRTSARASIWQLHMMAYHDNLCADMGVPHKRKANPLAEVFMPYKATDYAAVFEDAKAPASEAPPRPPLRHVPMLLLKTAVIALLCSVPMAWM